MKIKPLHDVIAVKMDEVTTTTASGIVLASNKEKFQG
jgi:co-chaperonin GroES (HSP10)